MGLSPAAFANQAFIGYREPQQYREFRCSAAACEDTCCEGWSVPVDRSAYEKYQGCTHSELAPQLQRLVTINPTGSENHFATITLNGSGCPFLSERLCSIQRDLGEGFLGKVCATYPRIVNDLGAIHERSLDLSCPEAARLVLTRVEPTVLSELPQDGGMSIASSDPAARHPFFFEIRSSLLSILQNRRYPISQRLTLVGHVCDRLSEIERSGATHTVPQMLQAFAAGINSGLYDARLAQFSANAAKQLNIVLELIITRVQLDFTQQRFMKLYQEFMDGLEMQTGSTIGEISARYAEAYRSHYAPFTAAHEYVMEQYLVHYAYKTLFPFGSDVVNRTLTIQESLSLFTAHYMLIGTYYAVTKSLMIGVAARYRSAFNLDHAVRCIQSCSKTLEHCSSYPQRILDFLTSRGIRNAAAMSLLTQDPSSLNPA